jgi:tight adherence protein C
MAAFAAAGAAVLAVFGLAEVLAGGPVARRPRRMPRARIGDVLRLLQRLPGGRLASPAALDLRLDAAGRPYGAGWRELIGAKLLCAATAGISALALAGNGPGRLGLLLAVAAPAAGFMAPDFRLARLTAARVRLALRDLPDMLDLLRVTVQAGQSPPRALEAVGAEFDGPLAAEWRRVAMLAALGQPLDSALRTLERRLPCEEVSSFAQAMRDARRHGTPLAAALASQASRARHRRRHRIREEAARAGPKVQLVVALVLVPSVLLFIAAALLANVSSAGLGLPL